MLISLYQRISRALHNVPPDLSQFAQYTYCNAAPRWTAAQLDGLRHSFRRSSSLATMSSRCLSHCKPDRHDSRLTLSKFIADAEG